MVADGPMLEQFEPVKRACECRQLCDSRFRLRLTPVWQVLLSESVLLPSFEDAKEKSGIKDETEQPRTEGYYLSQAAAALYWFPKGRLTAMGKHYWMIEHIEVRAGSCDTEFIDLTGETERSGSK